MRRRIDAQKLVFLEPDNRAGVTANPKLKGAPSFRHPFPKSTDKGWFIRHNCKSILDLIKASPTHFLIFGFPGPGNYKHAFTFPDRLAENILNKLCRHFTARILVEFIYKFFCKLGVRGDEQKKRETGSCKNCIYPIDIHKNQTC